MTVHVCMYVCSYTVFNKKKSHLFKLTILVTIDCIFIEVKRILHKKNLLPDSFTLYDFVYQLYTIYMCVHTYVLIT